MVKRIAGIREMITRVGDHLQRRQLDEEAPLDSNPTTTHDMNPNRPSDSVFSGHQSSSAFEAGGLDGTDNFSLELEDLWNMVISSDSWMTQDIIAAGESTAMQSTDRSAT